MGSFKLLVNLWNIMGMMQNNQFVPANVFCCREQEVKKILSFECFFQLSRHTCENGRKFNRDAVSRAKNDPSFSDFYSFLDSPVRKIIYMFSFCASVFQLL